MTQPHVHRPHQPGQPHGGSSPAERFAPTRAYSDRAFPDQPYSGQQHSGQQHSGQQHSGQQHSGQPYSGQQYPSQPHSGNEYPGQQHSAPPNHWPPNPGPPAHSFDRPPYPEHAAAGQFDPGRAFPGPPSRPDFPARPGARYAPAPAPVRRPPRRRRLALVLGLFVVAGLAATAVVLGAAMAAPVRLPDTGAIQQPGTLSVFALQAGDCYNSTQAPPPPGQSQPISVVEAVQCNAPHTDQVIGRITYSPTEYATGVPDTKADADCTGEFQAKLDPAAFSDPTLKPGRLAPADPATWARTPVVACVVFSDSPISRSLLR